MKSSSDASVKVTYAGSSYYLKALTLVATIGGFLFGFDTAVVNGAEKSLVDLYISKAVDPDRLFIRGCPDLSIQDTGSNGLFPGVQHNCRTDL